MEKIPSFLVNHLTLLRGIYVSRKDPVGDEILTSFDIRMKEPNREPVMDIAALHTLEHLGATYLRNDPEWKDRIIYFGPMGCRTGNYLVVRGDYSSKEILPLIIQLYRFMADFSDPIPGAAARDCGNWLNHDLPMARWESKKYLTEVLEKIQNKNLEYPAD